jgi:hypothetical protein
MFAWDAVDSCEGYRIYRALTAQSAGVLRASKSSTGYIDEADTTAYVYWVTSYKGALESPPSNTVSTRDSITDPNNVPPQWRRDTMAVSLNEGDSATLVIKDSCVAFRAGATLSFSLPDSAEQGVIIADSLYRFTAGNRDSGVYFERIIADDGRQQDTAVVKITVSAVSFTLSVSPQPVNGTITLDPLAASYRWGDTITVTANASAGYIFDAWSDTALLGDQSVVQIILKANASFSATFKRITTVNLTPGISLNEKIVEFSVPAQRPALLVPAEGLYDQGTLGVEGKMDVLLE